MPPTDEKVLAAARRAADAWRAAMRVRRDSRPMPPWDEFAFADTPISKAYLLPNGVDVLVAEQNPNRIALLFSLGTGVGAGTYVRPAMEIVSGSLVGLRLPSPGVPLAITQKDYLNLCQVEWHALSDGGAGTLTVVEVILRTWPKG